MSDVRREGRSTVVIVVLLAPAFPSLNRSGLHKGFKALQKEYPEMATTGICEVGSSVKRGTDKLSRLVAMQGSYFECDHSS